MVELYKSIKDVEDKSASYGKGLYLLSTDKASYMECNKPGSIYYWQTLKTIAANFRSFLTSKGYIWLGSANGSYALYICSNSNVHNLSNQYDDYIIAPAFNLDLSKVEIVGDEIAIKDTCNNIKKEKIRECLDEIFKESEILPENFGERILEELEERFLEDGYEITKKTVIEEMLWCHMCKMQ